MPADAERLGELLLLIRDDCEWDGHYYLLRPYTVERLLEEAIHAAQQLKESGR